MKKVAGMRESDLRKQLLKHHHYLYTLYKSKPKEKCRPKQTKKLLIDGTFYQLRTICQILNITCNDIIPMKKESFQEICNKNEYDQSTLTNANLDGDQTIFYTSNKKRKNPATSTPESAFKRLERSLKDMSANTRSHGSSKDFIAANIAAAKTHNRTNQSKLTSNHKKRNPRAPNLNNSKPIASNTRSRAPSFNKSAVRQQQNIKDKSDKLQKSAQK